MADKFTKSAKGKQCQIRIPGYCETDSRTVCFAHLGGAGMGIKHLSIHGAYGCQTCHDVVDGRMKSIYKKDLLKLWHLEGVIRTQEIMVENGLIVL